MAKKTSRTNGRTRLEEALATLIQTQAAFVKDMAEVRREHAELERKTDQRFAEIIRILAEHGRILTQLPEAIRDKIGFKTPADPASRQGS